VTEAEWLAATDPSRMLTFVRDSGQASFRRCWLFTAACCARADFILTPELARTAARISELLATKEAHPEERRAAREVTRRWKETFIRARDWEAAASVRAFEDLLQRPAQSGFDSAQWAIQLLSLPDWSNPEDGWDIGQPPPRRQSPRTMGEYYRHVLNILRCIFARVVADFDPALRAWNDGAVPQIARSIYDDRAFDRTPLLADALEDAGCTDTELLGHLRGSGPHARGCRGLDLILVKN
jgi:hypothetical protein